jgi:hypothetical protein
MNLLLLDLFDYKTPTFGHHLILSDFKIPITYFWELFPNFMLTI